MYKTVISSIVEPALYLLFGGGGITAVSLINLDILMNIEIIIKIIAYIIIAGCAILTYLHKKKKEK